MKKTISIHTSTFFTKCFLHFANCKYPFANSQLQISNWKSPLTTWKFPFANFLLLIANCLFLTTYAQTNILAGNVSGTWTKAASPYKIQGEIIVPKGSTLTLEPGAVLEFQGLYGIKVDGILKAEGKKGDSITFMAAANKVWGGIHYFKNTQIDTIRFNYCHFENVGYGSRYNFVNYVIACFYCSTIKIKNSSFYFNNKYHDQTDYIYIRKTVAIIDSLLFNGSADISRLSYPLTNILIDSISYFSISNITAKNIKIFSTVIIISVCNNQNKSIINSINLTNSLRTEVLLLYYSQYITVNNIYCYKTRNGILMNNSERCNISNLNINNSLQAIYTRGDCTGSQIENSTFEGCGTANTNFDYASLNIQSSGLLFKNCKFINNKRGITVYQRYGSGTPLFLNCLFDNTKAGSAVSINGSLIFINCNFQNSTDLKYYGIDLNVPYGGGISVVTGIDKSRPYFYNCLLWGNKDSFGHHNNVVLYGKVVKADFKNCIIQGDSSTGIVGYDDNKYVKIRIPTGNLTYANSTGNAPGFIDSAAGNYQLLNTCSKAAYGINRGMSGNLLSQYPFNFLNNFYGVNIFNTTDLAGNPRIADDTLDICCYENTGTKKSLKLLSSYPHTTLCYGSKKTYTSKTAGTVQTYLWQQKQGAAITNLATTHNIVLTNLKITGLQYRLLVKNNECLPLKDSSAWFTINVNKPIAKGIAKNPNKDTITPNQTMQLSTTPSGFSKLLWSTGAITPNIIFKGNSLGAIGNTALA